MIFFLQKLQWFQKNDKHVMDWKFMGRSKINKNSGKVHLTIAGDSRCMSLCVWHYVWHCVCHRMRIVFSMRLGASKLAPFVCWIDMDEDGDDDNNNVMRIILLWIGTVSLRIKIIQSIGIVVFCLMSMFFSTWPVRACYMRRSAQHARGICSASIGNCQLAMGRAIGNS